jgi:hypothetical protein
MNWQRSDPTPALLALPPAAASLDEAHRAIEQWEHYSGKTLDSAQRLAVEMMMAESASGRWAARTTGRCVSRQNGKGDELEVVEAWGLTQRAEAIVHTAHEIPTAKSAHSRLVGLLYEGHKDLRRKVKKVRYANGDQNIEMVNGGIIVYRTRTSGGGRGLDDISRLIVDEAQHAQPEQLASSTPILAANPNPQINFAGTAGIDGVSRWWWSMRKRALSGVDEGDFAWLEHSAEAVSLDDAGSVASLAPDAEDRDGWTKANPGFPSRIEEGYLWEQYRILGPALFAREHLCVWDPEPDAGESIIPASCWTDCGKTDAAPKGRVVYSVDVSPDGASGSIAASDGVRVLVADSHPGTAWIVASLVDLTKANPGPVYLDPKGPAGLLLAQLSAVGIEAVQVTPGEHAQACGGLLAAVISGELVHERQPVLDLAVKGATRRPYGDAWAWNRRSATVDISPLVAVTLARWAATTSKPTEVFLAFA